VPRYVNRIHAIFTKSGEQVCSFPARDVLAACGAFVGLNRRLLNQLGDGLVIVLVELTYVVGKNEIMSV
jgi:hypothetical protein